MSLKRFAVVFAQTGVTLGLLGWFFREESFRSEIWSVVTRADARWLLAGLAIAGVETLLGSLRWFLFLRMLSIRIPFRKVLPVQLLGMFFNTIMIGAVGGDVIKVACLIRDGHRKTRALLSVLLDRMSGLAALLCATAVLASGQYAWLARSPLVAGLLHFVFAYLVIVTLLLAMSFVLCKFGHSERMPQWAPFREAILDLVSSYSLFVRQWRTTMAAAAMSFAMLICYFLVYYCGARAFGVREPLVQWMAIMVIVDVIAALPVSLGGVGLREQVFAVVLGHQFGVSPAAAFSVSMAGFLMGASWGLGGAAVLPFFRSAVRDVRNEAAHAVV